MPPDPKPFTDFSVHVAPAPDGGTDVAIFGELDLATADAVEDALETAIEQEGPVVIDLRACGFVDSSGVAVLVKAALRLREQHRSVVLKGVQPRVMRILDLAGITSMDELEIEPQPSSEGPAT